MEILLKSEADTWSIGNKLGQTLQGGEVIELVGDVGAGKTALTKAIAAGMGIDDDIQSPTFTLSRVYDAPSGNRLAHYDFYRLQDAGILRAELDEVMHDAQTVTVIEWSGIVSDILPNDRLVVELVATAENSRCATITATGDHSKKLLDGAKL